MKGCLILNKEKLVKGMTEGSQGLFGDKIMKKIIQKILDKLLMIIMIHNVLIKTCVRS